MSKYCPVYNCLVLYMDCQECESKACKYISARKLKIHKGAVIEVKSLFGKEQRFLYLGKKKIDEYKSKRIMYRFEDKEIILVDSDFFKLKKAKVVCYDNSLLNQLKQKYKW